MCNGLAFPSGFELDADARVDEGIRRDILVGGKLPKVKPKAEAKPKAKAEAKRTYVDAYVDRLQETLKESESLPAPVPTLAELFSGADEGEKASDIPTPVVGKKSKRLARVAEKIARVKGRSHNFLTHFPMDPDCPICIRATATRPGYTR